MHKKDLLTLDMRAPLVGYALRRWSVDCSSEHSLDPKEHHLWLNNPQTLYGVESATLAPGYGDQALGVRFVILNVETLSCDESFQDLCF
jgi:hypothetical protein